MAKVIVGGKIRTFDPSKHRRGTNGRFVDKPDYLEVTGRKSSSTRGARKSESVGVSRGFHFERKKKVQPTKGEIKSQARQIRDAKKAAQVYRDRLELYAGLSIEQRQRLRQIITTKSQEPDNNTPSVTPSTSKPAKKPKASSSTPVTTPANPPAQPRQKFTRKTDKSVLKKYAREGDLSQLEKDELALITLLRAPTARYPGRVDDIDLTTPKVTIWGTSDTQKYSSYDPTFKVRTDKKQEYKITAKDGAELVLNRHPNKISFQGETVEGVPSLHPKLAEMTDKALFKSLIETKGYVESSEAPPAPQWKPTFHGKVDTKYVAGRGYGGMEIHHIDQWAKKRFDQITSDLDNGVITLDDAKDQMRSLLRANPKEKIGYEIDIQDQSTRRFVVLAAGTHNFTSPLYEANHPLGIHPDTGERVKFGIPKNGSGGRNEFNKWRDGFWREVYRRETYVLLGEINRRISKGKLSREDAEELLRNAKEDADKQLTAMLTYRSKVESRNEEIRLAKQGAGL